MKRERKEKEKGEEKESEMKKKKKKKKGTTAAAKVNRTKSRRAISWTMPNRRFKPVFFFPSQLDEEYV